MKRSLGGVSQIAFRLAASGGLGWLALRALDWDLVRDELEGVSVSLIVLVVAVFMFASYLRAYRWQPLFITEKISTPRLFVIQNEGIGLNNGAPVRAASEPTQLAVLTLRDRVDGVRALATLGMERVIDVIASTMILVVAFFLVRERENFTLYVWGAVGFTVVAVVVVFLLRWGSMAVSLFRRIRFLMAFAKAIKDLVAHRGRLVASLLAGVTAWPVALAIDLDISLTITTLVIMGTIFFTAAVPSVSNAIGTFEFAVIYVLEFFDVRREAGFGFTVLTQAVFFLPPTLIAAVFLSREGIGSTQRLTSLVGRGVRAGDSGAA